MSLVIATPPTYPAERAYILDVMLGEFLGISHAIRTEPRQDVEIRLAGDASERRLTLPDILFSTPRSEWLEPSSLPETPLAVWELSQTALYRSPLERAIPVIFGERLGNGAFAELAADEGRLGLDVFGSAFFMLTRYEEIACPDRDARDRFPASAALAGREGFLHRPLVNEYLELLWSALRALWPGLERRDRTFREVPTHDVDWPVGMAATPAAIVKHAASDGLIGRDPHLALARLKSLRARRRGRPEDDACFTFDFIMDTSEERGLRSLFHFITAHTGGGSLDGNYSIDDPWIRRLMRRIHERGHEIGLHPSYMSFRDPRQMRAEFAALLRACEQEGIAQDSWATRQHFLRWENPTTWQACEDAGLDLDSTLGYSDRLGFRCGVCFEYPAFNLRTGERLALRERPLVAMEIASLDVTAMSFERGLDLAHETAATELLALKQRCRDFGGDFVLLWHNNRLVSRRSREIYGRLLEPSRSGTVRSTIDRQE